MAQISSDINTIIDYLIKKREEGYRSVELITKAREYGWRYLDGETLTFIKSESEPTILGIDAR